MPELGRKSSYGLSELLKPLTDHTDAADKYSTKGNADSLEIKGGGDRTTQGAAFSLCLRLYSTTINVAKRLISITRAEFAKAICLVMD